MLAFVYTCISFGVLYKQEKAKPFKVTTLLALGEDVLHDLIATRKGTLIALNVAASVVIFSALATTRVFLGQLSVIESQQLIDRMLRFILLKVLFLGAVVDPEPAANVAAYLVWACVTCALKAFVGLARWRLESLLSSPIATIWQHLRCVGLLAVMLAEDALWISAGLRLAGANSLYSWAFLWYFDAACVGIEGVHAGIRYFICGIDRLRAQRGGHCGEEEDEDTCTNLESQNQFFYMLDLASDLVVHALNLVHYGHILHLRGGLRLQLIDVALLTDVRFLLAAAWRRVQGHFLYRNLTHKLRHCFPDASLESLAKEGGVTCAICMENMRVSTTLSLLD
jgi:autocrine motility factor receptor